MRLALDLLDKAVTFLAVRVSRGGKGTSRDDVVHWERRRTNDGHIRSCFSIHLNALET